MEEKKKGRWILLGVFVFLAYLVIAAEPVQKEMVLAPAWLIKLDQDTAAPASETVTVSGATATAQNLPFHIGSRYGYLDPSGHVLLAKTARDAVSISNFAYCEYPAIPSTLEFHGPRGEILATTTERGYPWFADGGYFIVAPEQNALSALNRDGTPRWKRDFGATITCLDAKGGLVLVGLLDGSIELLDGKGDRKFQFEPGASRIPVIVAAKLSSDGKRIALISGIDSQRFILLELSGINYKVVFHTFLDSGFRRPVLESFTNDNQWVLFEREGKIGIFDCEKRKLHNIAIASPVAAFDTEDTNDRIFLLTSGDAKRTLHAIDLPNREIFSAPFASNANYIERESNRIYLASDEALIAMDISTR